MENIELYPIFDRFTLYNDHYDGELKAIGDALGRDCMIASFEKEKPQFMRLYKNDGSRNEDWYSWNAKVYAPVSGTIKNIFINEITNVPGIMNPSRASIIHIEAEDHLNIVIAHIQNPTVKIGDSLTEGQVIAYVGNNGYARSPHIHIGAFKNNIPVSISFDPKKVAVMRSTVSDGWWAYGDDTIEFE